LGADAPETQNQAISNPIMSWKIVSAAEPSDMEVAAFDWMEDELQRTLANHDVHIIHFEEMIRRYVGAEIHAPDGTLAEEIENKGNVEILGVLYPPAENEKLVISLP
jgi:hypothetical protein